MLKTYFKKLPHALWGFTSLKFVGQTGRLETQAGFCYVRMETLPKRTHKRQAGCKSKRVYFQLAGAPTSTHDIEQC